MLCRETGYRPILETAKHIVAQHSPVQFPAVYTLPTDLEAYVPASLVVYDDMATYYRPITLAEVLKLKVLFELCGLIDSHTLLML